MANPKYAMEERDLRYMRDPDNWNMMVCPLKRDVNGNREVGMLIGDGPKVHIGNMYLLQADDGHPVKEYASFEALQRDGWRVD